jgi:hypothetical protein
VIKKYPNETAELNDKCQSVTPTGIWFCTRQRETLFMANLQIYVAALRQIPEKPDLLQVGH